MNSTNGIEEATSWSSLPDASDSTKVVVTPYVENVSFGEPGVIESSENIDGAPFAIATGHTPVSFQMRNLSGSQRAALKSLKDQPSLVVYFVYVDDKIGAKLLSSSPDTHVGIPISYRTVQVQDPSREGTKADEFMTTMTFALPENWSSTFSVTTAEAGFSPKTDIKPS
ncbi:hypothetical protein EP331_00360 [bacterium]|nr:MAG: hypothetical protein EP331_00360 [bacterium]